MIIEEVGILNRLDHPNIVKYFETYDDNRYMYLVMEYIKGQQLFEKITAQENQTFLQSLTTSSLCTSKGYFEVKDEGNFN